jgi:hypothetical protein
MSFCPLNISIEQIELDQANYINCGVRSWRWWHVMAVDLFLSQSAQTVTRPHFAMAPIAASVRFATDNACRSVINCFWFTLFWIPRTKHFICLHQSAVLTGFVVAEHRRMCWHWHTPCMRNSPKQRVRFAGAIERKRSKCGYCEEKHKRFGWMGSWSSPPSAFFVPPLLGYFRIKNTR